MKKLIKILLVCGAVFLVLLAAGLITLKIMFPPEKLKAMAVSYAQDNLHREVSFDGVSFNLIGVTLHNFALSEETSFKQGTFVKADELQVKVALKPLFEKKIEISTVLVDGLKVNVIKQKDGTFNFDSLTAAASGDAPEQAAPDAAEQEALAFDLTAEKINVKNCAFSYQDEQTGMNASVDKLNLEILDFDFKNPFSFKVNFTTDYREADGLSVTVPVTVNTVVSLADLDLDKAYVTVKGISATYKTVKFMLTGGVKSFTAPEIDLTGTLSGVDNQIFEDFLPDLPHFSLPQITVNVKASADLDKSSAFIRQIKLAVLNSGLTASGSAGWAGPEPTYNLSANLALHLDEIVQMTDTMTDFKPQGQISGSFKATDKLDGKDVSGSVTLKDVSVLYEPFKASALNGVIKIASLDDVSCSALTGLLNGEKLSTSFSYKNVKDVMNIVFNLDLAKLTLDKFPASAETTEQTSSAAQPSSGASAGPETYMNVRASVKVGQVNVPYFTAQGFNLNANLTGVSASMKKANGQITFTLLPGAITDLDSFVKQNRIVRIILLPIAIVNRVAKALNVELFPAENAAKKGQITYDSADGEYNFVNGVMTVAKTSLASKLTNINGSGSVNFPKDDIDMKVSATLLTSQTPIVMKITGTLDNPKGKLDVINTVGSLVGGILNYKTPGKVVNSTANAAGSVATGAVKTGVDVTKGAANVATDTVKGTVNVAKDALKGLGGLFKKSDKAQEEKAESK